MRILEVREQTVSIASEMANAVISFRHMTVSLVAVVSDVVRNGERLVGFGFNSNGRYAQGGLLKERFIPRLLAADPVDLEGPQGFPVDPVRARRVLMAGEKPGGHGDRAVAVGILDMALWDLVAKVADVPAAQAISRRFGLADPAPDVAVYAAGGYYRPGGDVRELTEEIRRYLDAGYEQVKIKVGGASLDEDRRRIDAVVDVVGDPGRLAVDANGRWSLAEAVAAAEALAPLGLRWLEEPCDPLDFAGHAAVAEVFPQPVATGENLLSVPDVRNLLRHGGLRPGRDVLQMDPALAYGVAEYQGMLALAAGRGWPPSAFVPHGGHQLNLAVAAAFGLGGCESYPGIFQPFGGFADETPVEGGRARLSDAAGLGLERKAGLRPLLERLCEA